MANILGLITINEKEYLEVDASPEAGAGTPAPIGSQASFDNGSGVGQLWAKIGVADTAWDRILTATTGGVGQGTMLRLPIYDLSPNGYHVDDEVLQNTKKIVVALETQAARSADIVYRIPNPGNAVAAADFVLTEGDQTINGNKTFGGNVQINGTLTYINATNLEISDPLIRLNKGGAAASGAGVGFEVEEDSAVTGYFKTAADRAGWVAKVPASAYTMTLDYGNLSASRIQKFADTAGTFVMRPTGTPGVNTQLAFWTDANNLSSSSGLTWSGTTLSVTSLTIPTFTLGSVIFAGTAGILAQNNANFFWDNTNARLGLGTTAPARLLDVNGTSQYRGAMKIAIGTKGSFETLQAQALAQTGNAYINLATVAVPADSVIVVTATITGRRVGGTAGAAGDCATYIRTARIVNNGGTVTRPTLQSDFTSESQAGWDGTIDVSGTDFVIKTRGATNNTIDWTVTYTMQTLS